MKNMLNTGIKIINYLEYNLFFSNNLLSFHNLPQKN